MSIRNEISFSNILRKNFEFIRNIEVLFEVSFPLVFSFEANENKKYLAYVLDFKRRKKVLNIMFVETNNELLYDLLNQNISLRAALTKNEPHILYLDSNELYDNVNEVLPKDNFLITELMPNNVDIVSKRRQIAFELESEKKYYDTLFKMKKVRKKYNELFKLISSTYADSLNTVFEEYESSNNNKHTFWPYPESKLIREKEAVINVSRLKTRMNDIYVLSDNFESK